MSHQTQRSPKLAVTGFSENIHIASVNNKYLTMILKNTKCQAVCCEFLNRYEELLQKFEPSDSRVYQGNEIDAFIALSNLERLVDANEVSL